MSNLDGYVRMSRRDKTAITGEMMKLIEFLDDAGGEADLCPQCGEIKSKDVKYCDSCGAKLKPVVKVKRILDNI